jgi:predicted cupin superfamily sugar epimerase
MLLTWFRERLLQFFDLSPQIERGTTRHTIRFKFLNVRNEKQSTAVDFLLDQNFGAFFGVQDFSRVIRHFVNRPIFYRLFGEVIFGIGR